MCISLNGDWMTRDSQLFISHSHPALKITKRKTSGADPPNNSSGFASLSTEIGTGSLLWHARLKPRSQLEPCQACPSMVQTLDAPPVFHPDLPSCTCSRILHSDPDPFWIRIHQNWVCVFHPRPGSALQFCALCDCPRRVRMGDEWT